MSKNAPQSQRAHIAQQVMDMYAPLANRLGVGQLKWMLEDYAFRYLAPENLQKNFQSTQDAAHRT